MKNEQNNAKDLKVGSILEINEFIADLKKSIKVEQTIYRVSDTYVWFKGMDNQRIGRETIRKYPEFYRIVQI